MELMKFTTASVRVQEVISIAAPKPRPYWLFYSTQYTHGTIFDSFWAKYVAAVNCHIKWSEGLWNLKTKAA